MATTARPYVREMIAEAIGELGPVITNTELRDWILAKYPGTKKNTIQSATRVRRSAGGSSN